MLPFDALFSFIEHGNCCAQRIGVLAQGSAERLADIAAAMGVALAGASAAQNAANCLDGIRKLSVDVGIPKGLLDLGVKDGDIPTLAANALKDACGLTNPRRADQADIEGIFRAAL